MKRMIAFAYLLILVTTGHLAWSNGYSRMAEGIQENTWKVEIITWNIAAIPPPPNLDLTDLFNNALDADVIAIGLQEVDYYPHRYLSGVVSIREEPWSQRFREFLSARDYVQLTCSWTTRPRLMGIILMTYVPRRRLLNIQRVETKFCKTGFSGYSSHKGAVSTRLTLSDGSHMTFLCAHFAPWAEALAYRIKEYNMVLNCIQYDSKNVVSDDYIFWLGDLNFRVEGFSLDESLRLIEHNYIEKLLEYDQLKRCMESRRAFYHFHEPQVTFKPTYKYLLGTSNFDIQRIPSWCDRILWRVESAHRHAERQLDCQSLRYESKMAYTNSDHKPVLATFQIRVFNLNIPALIRFRYPARNATWFSYQNNLCQYVVARNYAPASFDWIGLFKPNFKSDDDVITWAYTVTSWEEGQKESDGASMHNLLFKRQYIPIPGTYVLGYYSRDRSCLIGLSDPFEISPSAIEDAKEAKEI